MCQGCVNGIGCVKGMSRVCQGCVTGCQGLSRVVKGHLSAGTLTTEAGIFGKDMREPSGTYLSNEGSGYKYGRYCRGIRKVEDSKRKRALRGRYCRGIRKVEDSKRKRALRGRYCRGIRKGLLLNSGKNTAYYTRSAGWL